MPFYFILLLLLLILIMQDSSLLIIPRGVTFLTWEGFQRVTALLFVPLSMSLSLTSLILILFIVSITISSFSYSSPVDVVDFGVCLRDSCISFFILL